MLVGQDLKDHAISILENVLPVIEIGYYEAGDYDQSALDEVRKSVGEFMSRVLETDIPINPEYTKKAELAAELVHFSYSHPDEFGEMFAESAVEWNHDIDIRTTSGFHHLLTFLGSICDDHSYCLDPASEKPLVKLIDQFEVPVRSFGPNTLLSAMQEYRNTLVGKPAVETGALNIGR